MNFFTELNINIKKKSKELAMNNYLDKSEYFEKVLKEHFDGKIKGFLAETQIAFVVFQIGEIYEGFEQWMKLMCLFFQAYKYSKRLPKLVKETSKNEHKNDGITGEVEKSIFTFVEAAYHMLRFCGRDLFEEEANMILFNSIQDYIEEVSDYYKDTNSLDNEDKRKQAGRILKVLDLFSDFMGEYFGKVIRTEEDKIIEYYLMKMKINENKGSEETNSFGMVKNIINDNQEIYSKESTDYLYQTEKMSET
eukprot:CAMPEP_0170524390 /NCGR_PEP_ID=MMETSP0209-20121228/9831_1 /TAXON_ID=665100 ORGANISM="Litonotus pictus, Strain P1" /NCGR_SAMPLE_ID=MMETSP0209 /ASSEMBLY_ACC=CAM_ASM_000301 /LENGTH=249 /DNA_ID=CAMNT_0010813045 /DNA_START=524 /DNA_END=1269 /DNA_ORIENTATION=+